MSTFTPAPTAPPAASGARPPEPPRAIPATRRSARKTRSAAGRAVLVVLLLVFTLFPAFWMLSSAFDAKAGAGGQTLLPREWSLGHLSRTVPVFVAEWGGGPEHVRWGETLIRYLRRLDIGWAAWSWSDYPRLVVNAQAQMWDPTAFGHVVRRALTDI